MMMQRIRGGLRALGEFHWDYLDLAWPTKRDAMVVVAAFAIYLAAVPLLDAAVGLVSDVGAAQHATAAEATPGVPAMQWLAMVASAWLLVVFEEYTFRNLLQKTLYVWMHPTWAILATSMVFAALHIPAYGGLAQSPLALVTPLGTVFVGSLILGTAYWRTQNLTVSVAVHGAINTLALYVAFFG